MCFCLIDFLSLLCSCFYIHVQVLEKLEQLLAGFESVQAEPLYILIGSFVSKPVNRTQGGREIMQSAFDALGELIARYPHQAQQAKFLLVPGEYTTGRLI